MDVLFRLLHVVPTNGHIHLPSNMWDKGEFDALLVSGLDGGHSEMLRELDELRHALGRSRERIFIVPGVFDVDRAATKADRNLDRLVMAVREGRESIDDVLDNVVDKALIVKRFTAFRAQAQALSLPYPLFWHETIAARDGQTKVTVIGLNSVLVSTFIRDDCGPLSLGLAQVAPALLDGPDAIFALSYYPFGEGWFHDEKRVVPWIKTRPATQVLAADMAKVKKIEPVFAKVYALVKGKRGLEIFAES